MNKTLYIAGLLLVGLMIVSAQSSCPSSGCPDGQCCAEVTVDGDGSGVEGCILNEWDGTTQTVASVKYSYECGAQLYGMVLAFCGVVFASLNL